MGGSAGKRMSLPFFFADPPENTAPLCDHATMSRNVMLRTTLPGSADVRSIVEI